MKPVSGHALAAGSALLLAACLSGCPQQGRPRGFVLELVGPGSGLSMTTTSGRTPPTQILEVKGAGGVALIDYDADEDLDVFISNGATLEAPEEGSGARLFENLGEMRFRDVTGESGLSLHRWGFGPAGQVGGNPTPGLAMLPLGVRLIQRAPAGSLHADLAACDAYRAPDAASIKLPVLLLQGSADRMTPAKGAKAFVEAIAQSEIRMLDGIGHMVMPEAPDAVTAALRDFIR